MQINEYQQKVLRTDLEDYSGFQERLKQNKDTVHAAIKGFMISSGALDLMKKKIAYDANPVTLMKNDAEHSAALLNFKSDVFIDKISENKEYSQLFHYVIGMITECNELMVALCKGAITGNLDKINVGEEVSDVLWYQGVMCERLGIDMSNLLEVNIKKLQTRYPNKFTEDEANTRDLNKERDVLDNETRIN